MAGYTNEIKTMFNAQALRQFALHLASKRIDPSNSEYSQCLAYGSKSMTIRAASRAGDGFNQMLVRLHDGRDCIISIGSRKTYMIVGQNEWNVIKSVSEFAKQIAFGFFIIDEKRIDDDKISARARYRTYLACKKFNDRMTHLHFITSQYIKGKQNGKPNLVYIKDSIDYFRKQHCTTAA